MINEFFAAALENGLWAALFCLLFIYELRDSRTREGRYCDTIKKLTDALGGLENISQSCNNIKSDCSQIKSDCGDIKRKIKGEQHQKPKNSKKSANAVVDNMNDSAVQGADICAAAN